MVRWVERGHVSGSTRMAFVANFRERFLQLSTRVVEDNTFGGAKCTPRCWLERDSP